MTSAGNNFNYFPENQWIKLSAVLTVHFCICSAAKFLRQPFGRFILPLPPIFSLCLRPPIWKETPEIQLGGLQERCELCQRGLGRSPSRFYQRVSIASYASAGIARAEMSVCPSVCPSHSGIVSKRRKLAS